MSERLSSPYLQALIDRCGSHGEEYALDPEMTRLLGFESSPSIRIFGIQDAGGVHHMFGALADGFGILLLRSTQEELRSYRLGPSLALVAATNRNRSLRIVTSHHVTEEELAAEFGLWRIVASDIIGALPDSTHHH